MVAILTSLLQIAWYIVLPLILLISAGYLLQRRLGLDVNTLIRLNFYVVVPGMVYYSVVDARLPFHDMAVVVGFTLLVMFGWFVVALITAMLRGIRGNRRRVLVMTSIFTNSGNYGLPLQQLTFRQQGFESAAMSLQVFVIIIHSLLNFTLGVLLASGKVEKGQLRKHLGHITRFPPIYATLAAISTLLILHLYGDQLSPVAGYVTPFWQAMQFAKEGYIVVALVTLGAQMASLKPHAARYPVAISVLLRLIAGPSVGLGLILLMGLDGLMGQVLLISTATPVAINTMLLCLEFDNHPDYAARVVFYSTLYSPITVSLVILLARSGVL